MIDQAVAVEHVHIDRRQVGREDSHQLFMGGRGQAIVQPQGGVAVSRAHLVEFDRAELGFVVRGANVAEVQVRLIVDKG